MIKRKNKEEARQARHARVRKKISGTPETPRLCVYRSLKNIYAQIIDDTTGKTLVSASTLDADLKANYGGNKEAAKAVGCKSPSNIGQCCRNVYGRKTICGYRWMYEKE